MTEAVQRLLSSVVKVVSPRERFEAQGLIKFDKPRLNYARNFFLEFDLEPDLDGIEEFYEYWRSFKEYIVIQRSEWKKNELENRIYAIKMSKRGNDVYWWKLNKKLKALKELKNKTFFNSRAKIKESNVLFVTLTYDSKRASVSEAWENIGIDFNRWITNLRAKSASA